MDESEDKINVIKCRTCLHEGNNMTYAHKLIEIGDNSISLTELLCLFTTVQIRENDPISQHLCINCIDRLRSIYKFRTECIENQKILEDACKRDKIPNKQNHLNYIPDLRPNSSTNINKSQRSSETCTECGKIFQYRTSMLRHRLKHNAPPKTCPHCDFTPETPAKLSKHMEQEHSDLKTITCPKCGKTFFKEANLRLHMLVHSGEKSHTCEICGLSFALRCNLLSHRRLHTGERPYTCSHCGRGFTQQAALRSHEVGHTNVKDQVCSVCGASFSRPGALKNHMKRHEGAKLFVCSMCGKGFTFSADRKRHMKIHTGIKDYVCEVCSRRFNRDSNLKVHMRIHSGELPFKCQVCGKGFVQAHCLKKHSNKHRDKSEV